jgi:hypothetical protein
MWVTARRALPLAAGLKPMFHHREAPTGSKPRRQNSFPPIKGIIDMSMRPRLWSLNGLATELGRDRRTMGKVLATSPADGKLSGHPAWLLTTALRALDGYEEPRTVSAVNSGDPLLGNLIDRIENWQEVHSDPPIEWPIGATAEGLGLSVETLVIWLRSGMPYANEGNLVTGAGFVLVPSWVIDWQAKLTVLNKLFGNKHTARQLGVE